jgi:hypothetical protein
MFQAVLTCLLGEVWTTPHIEELRLMADGGFLARLAGHAGFDHFLGAEEDLIRNIAANIGRGINHERRWGLL